MHYIYQVFIWKYDLSIWYLVTRIAAFRASLTLYSFQQVQVESYFLHNYVYFIFITII